MNSQLPLHGMLWNVVRLNSRYFWPYTVRLKTVNPLFSHHMTTAKTNARFINRGSSKKTLTEGVDEWAYWFNVCHKLFCSQTGRFITSHANNRGNIRWLFRDSSINNHSPWLRMNFSPQWRIRRLLNQLNMRISCEIHDAVSCSAIFT